MIYVVMASEGDYSDRVEWVCGAFESPEQAKALVDEKSRVSREAEQAKDLWWERYRSCVPKVCHETNMAQIRSWRAPNSLTPEQHAEITRHDAAEAAFKAEYGEAPAPEADEFWAVAVPLGEWGRWDRWHETASEDAD